MNKLAPSRAGEQSSNTANNAATIEALNKEISQLKSRIDRRNFKLSKVAES